MHVSAVEARADGLCIRLLGDFRVSVGERDVGAAAWRLRKAKSLVKLLALAPRHRLHREQIQDALWPEMAPEAGTNNLHKALHVARHAIEPHRAAGTPSSYLHFRGEFVDLDAPGLLWIDADAFVLAAAAAEGTRDPAAHRAALALYVGDLLPEDRYDDWAAGPREDLRRHYLRLLVGLARLHEAQGHYAPAIEALQRVTESDPVHEEAHAGLMRLYAVAGQRHHALRQYRRLEESLRRGLDAEPDVASQRLYAEILGGRESVGGRPDRHAHGVPGDRPRHNLPAPVNPLIGREREQEAVRLLVLQPAVRLVTLTGPPGIGKTRLALAAAASLLEAFADGVWFVALAPVRETDLVLRQVRFAG